ncbi:MAG: hypothetical protein OMM_09156 [Candidatus Magnetoglobus multicellularis str. Araruama]|uniref:Tetrapyrrole methylase domain-containing protein n=1 Tax=Candidatus Magnetoglobus multicellularis str. Araruama TaxID=890399 RepID=A0A1V1P579_9BACT|nr:MAG: hypothetical protein OMM_09156 [Candidatus Magnetoglobus multicellularis str. Araruama]
MENKELYPKQNHRVTVIGLGISLSDLTPCHMEIIKSADILVGGKRHLEFFECLSIKKRMIDRNLDLLFDFIGEQMPDNKIVVLASGDPLFLVLVKDL